MEKIIELKNIYKKFGNKDVLIDISTNIYKGLTHTIIGKSGAGKSVLIKHINKLIIPDSGKVYFKGKDISSFNVKELYDLRKKVGFLFQSGALFDSMNVYENLAFPLREHTNDSEKTIKKKVSEKLELVGMPNIEKLSTSELSGGMRKRVGLARTIILEPEIIIYDEPTTGLDPIMSDSINKLIIQMQKTLNITSIVITHDMKTVNDVSDRVVMISDCRAIFDGERDLFFKQSNSAIQNFIKGIS
ncbi:MAG: ABC transporter ATP-binding protein [Candidatus Cloacimonadota bacterium]|nr:MAG: ABC transporter ATP-binding protein [Candidatus Cloacimonadota bacterium]PIE80533.1 MAG: ABC transporter ATP-binding protein [Candidatus Delongbacteria bacterium]